MSGAQAGRRRRRRRTRRREEGTTYQPQETTPTQSKPSPRSFPEWNWRTFPVFFAFILGVVIMGIAIASPALGLVFFFGGLFGLAYGAAHILTRLWVGRRRG